jgi:hypothetical protein
MPDWCPVRIDFAGGWLDVPRLAIPGSYIVNCAVTPGIVANGTPYESGGGVGGSAALAILRGKDPFTSEAEAGVGWQDPAVLTETGLCVWRSGARPVLVAKFNPYWLEGLLALRWSGVKHETSGLVDKTRDYGAIVSAGDTAREAVGVQDLQELANAMEESHEAQTGEGMEPAVCDECELASKYCGSGWGGYTMHLFGQQVDRDAFVARDPAAFAIEPYMREVC